MSVTTGTFPGVRIVDMPDLGAVNDSSSVVGERAGSGRFNASAFRSYVLSDLLSVKSFGARGDGTTDDTATLNAALASGKSLYWPAGTYLVTGPLTITACGQRLYGAGAMSAIIRTSAPTGDVLTVSGTDLDIGHIGFGAATTRTNGAFVNLGNSSQVRLHDFYMTGWFVGVVIGIGGTSGGNSIYVERGCLFTTIASGFGIQCNAGVVAVLRDLLIEGNNTGGTQLTAGVNVGAFGDVTVDHIETIWAGNGVRIAPGASGITQAVWVSNSFFDTGSGYGVYANAAADGANIQLLKIDNCWIASNAQGGIALTTVGTGVIQQCDILNTISSNNTGHGLFIDSRVANTRVLGCSFGSNTVDGIIVSVNVLNFQIIGNWIGASGEFVGNATGLTIGNGCDKFTVADNIMNGNTTAAMNLGTLSGNAGVTYWIRDNLGFQTRNFGVLTTTAGPTTFTVTHGLAYTPNVAQVRLTLNSAPGAATYYYATNPTATTFQIVFNAAPGAGVAVAWEIHMLGG